MNRCAVVALASLALMCALAQASAPVRFAEASEVADREDASIIDLRPFGEYLRGHIPGAVHLDDECLRGPVAGQPVRYCDRRQLAALFGAAGVSLDRPVVVYASQQDPLPASMAAYALARVGHTDITILAGGYGAWAANHETTKAFPSVEAVDLVPGEPQLNAVQYDEFAASVGFDDVVFIDARPALQHRGDAPLWERNGHIPGAHSLDWTKITMPDNRHRLKPRAEIESMLRELGVSAWDDIVVYCGTGREATLLMIALTCELGWDGVRLYEGSWTEYITNEDAAIDVGARQEPKTRVFNDGTVRVSGQPTSETFEWLADEGVRTVISCRTDIEMDGLDFDQQAKLEKLGVDYVHIPMGGHWEYTPAQVAAFARAYEAADGDVLLHCGSGGRARLLWMAYLVEHQGVSPDEAWERSLELGGKTWSFERLLSQDIRLQTAE
ncbi:MAG: rhodanese-like domain-containing protein [Planctomycetota bacterium]